MKISIPRLRIGQLDRLSEFSSNLALVFFASLVVPIFSGIEKIGIMNVILGLAFTIGFLIISLFLQKGE